MNYLYTIQYYSRTNRPKTVFIETDLPQQELQTQVLSYNAQVIHQKSLKKEGDDKNAKRKT